MTRRRRSLKPQQIRTPQKTDEALLYKLNADIQLESRKHLNADEYIARIIRKFKQDNPVLIRRLMIEKSNSTNSVNTDKSLDPNSSKRESIDVVDVSIGNFNEENQNTSSRNFRRESNLIVDFSIGKLNEDNQNTTPRSFNNVKQALGLQKNYLNSAAPSTCKNIEALITDDEKYATVKSSTELLNTFTNIETLSIHEQNQTRNDALDTNVNVNNNLLQNYCTNDINNQYSDHSNVNNDNVDNIQSAYSESSDDGLNATNDHNDVIMNSSIESSNIADELTQVIGFDETGTQSKSESMNGSGNEELMTETINEINEELMNISVDNIILPPPCGFED